MRWGEAAKQPVAAASEQQLQRGPLATAAARTLPPYPQALVLPRCTLLQIPVQLRLADSEVSSLEQPPVLYVSPCHHCVGGCCA